jgi:hypothetical protein
MGVEPTSNGTTKTSHWEMIGNSQLAEGDDNQDMRLEFCLNQDIKDIVAGILGVSL